MARGLLDRADDGLIGSNMWLAYANAFLTYREHHDSEALTLLDRFLDTLGSRLETREHLQPSNQAEFIFTRALLGAELGHTDEENYDPRSDDEVGESHAADRDLLEIKLIARYAPPFNIKAER